MSLNEPRFFNKLGILTKIETAYGTDAIPAAANRIIMSNVTARPLVGERLSREQLLPYMGNQGVILTGQHATIEGDIEIAGSGAAGTPPLWGTIPRIAGMAETITAGTDVTYTRADHPLESASIYFIMDRVRHILVGCRANLSFSWSTSAIPRMRASITGLLGTISDQPNVNVSRTGWITPLPVSKVNTSLKLHGWDAVAESLSADLGNTVNPTFMIGDEAILISGQSATGSTVVQATSLATIDLFAKARSRERGALEFRHGITAGNIVELKANATELGEPTPGQWNGILNYTVALDLCTTEGFDDLELIVR